MSSDIDFEMKEKKIKKRAQERAKVGVTGELCTPNQWQEVRVINGCACTEQYEHFSRARQTIGFLLFLQSFTCKSRHQQRNDLRVGLSASTTPHLLSREGRLCPRGIRCKLPRKARSLQGHRQLLQRACVAQRFSPLLGRRGRKRRGFSRNERCGVVFGRFGAGNFRPCALGRE